MDPMSISLSALNVEWQRLQISAQNLANMNSTRSGDGRTYHPLRLVSGPDLAFADLLATPGATAPPVGVRVVNVEDQPNGLRVSYEPNHPHADSDGFVTYPNVDHAAEMTLMIRASRVYEANLAAVSIAQEMYNRALDLGRQS